LDYLLSHYQNVCVKEEVPYYHITKFKPVHFSKTDTTQTLWEKHADALKNPKISEQKPDQSLLDLKIELATRMLSQCSFCEHQCMVDRTQTKGYCRVEAMSLLDGIIDVYLIDYKFGRDSCAENLAHIPRYSEVIHRNLIIANKQADVLVRHLILPNHITCCSLPILYWLHDHLPNILLNIMGQYQPCYKAKDHPLIHRAITPQEYKTVQDTAKKLQLNVLS